MSLNDLFLEKVFIVYTLLNKATERYKSVQQLHCLIGLEKPLTGVGLLWTKKRVWKETSKLNEIFLELLQNFLKLCESVNQESKESVLSTEVR